MKESKPNRSDRPKSERIDKLVVDLGIITTRARAQAMIMAGHVLVNDVPVTKPGEKISLEAAIRLREPELKYVSRGSLKLKKAIEHFQIPLEGKVAIDIGSSTGGFTEVLLERGAKKVYAIDVGTNQLAWKIRNDARVEVRENCNARYLEAKDFSEKMEVFVMDVSFISIRKILPAVSVLLVEGAPCIVLFKPQFELGVEYIENGGIVKDQEYARAQMLETGSWASEFGFRDAQYLESPIQGTDGNTEYLIYWIKRGQIA